MVSPNKLDKKSGKGGTQDKADKAAKKAEKEKSQKKTARDGSIIPVAGPPKSEAELKQEKLLRVAKTMADSKKEKAARMLRTAELIATGMTPEDAAKQARDEAVERCKPQAEELMGKDQRGKKYSIKEERGKSSAPAVEAGSDSDNGSNNVDAAAGGEEQTDMTQNTAEKIPAIEAAADAPAPAVIETPAEPEPAVEAAPPVEDQGPVLVSNLTDLQPFVDLNGEVAVIDPRVQLVSADPETPAPLTLTTTYVVEVLGRNKTTGKIETRGYEFYPEEDSRLFAQAQTEGFNLHKNDAVKPRSLVAVLRSKKEAYDRTKGIQTIKFRDLTTWGTRGDMLVHIADPLAVDMVFGKLELEDKVKDAILNTWADFRDGFKIYLEEGDLNPHTLEEWADCVASFSDEWERRSKRSPRFPFRFVWTNMFREAEDGAVLAVPNNVFDAVTDELEEQGVRFQAAWPHRWLLITQGAQPWFAEQAEERKAQEKAQREVQAEAERKAKTLNKFQQRLVENGATPPSPTKFDADRGQSRRDDRGGRRQERGSGGRHGWDSRRYDSARD